MNGPLRNQRSFFDSNVKVISDQDENIVGITN